MADEFEENVFIYPVHLNPNVRKPVMQLLKNKKNIFLIDPLDYINFLYLMKKCSLIITDSGGLQEECPSLDFISSYEKKQKDPKYLSMKVFDDSRIEKNY